MRNILYPLRDNGKEKHRVGDGVRRCEKIGSMVVIAGDAEQREVDAAISTLWETMDLDAFRTPAVETLRAAAGCVAALRCSGLPACRMAGRDVRR